MTDKRALLDRLYAAWERAPSLRLGELLNRAAFERKAELGRLADERLGELVDLLVDEMSEETKR